MKRVLIVAFDFPPQGGTSTIRVAKFVKYLPQFGWEPVVVCSDTAWNPDASLLKDIPDGTLIRRVGWPRLIRPLQPAPRSAASGAPAQGGIAPASPANRLRPWLKSLTRHLLVPDTMVLWVPAARKACAEAMQEQTCDAVLTTSPPNSMHLIGRWVHQHYHVPWVADFRDVWTIDAGARRRLGRLGFRYHRWLENRLLATCDRVVTVSDPLAQRTQAVFGQTVAGKVISIPNGYDPADFGEAPLHVDDDSKFTVTYVGTVTATRADNAFPEGLALALQQDAGFRREVCVRFVGQLDPEYKARFEALKDHVDILDYAGHQTVIEMMSEADALLLLIAPTDEGQMSLTNKFFEYLAAKKPILALVPEGPVGDLVASEKLGLVASPKDAAGIAHSLLVMYNRWQSKTDGFGASSELLARFSRPFLASQLAAVLNEVTE